MDVISILLSCVFSPIVFCVDGREGQFFPDVYDATTERIRCCLAGGEEQRAARACDGPVNVGNRLLNRRFSSGQISTADLDPLTFALAASSFFFVPQRLFARGDRAWAAAAAAAEEEASRPAARACLDLI